MTTARTPAGHEIEAAPGEVLAHVRGETEFPCRSIAGDDASLPGRRQEAGETGDESIRGQGGSRHRGRFRDRGGGGAALRRGRRAGLVGAETMLNRPGTAREVANGIAFLASAEASYITGTCLFIDGGQTAL